MAANADARASLVTVRAARPAAALICTAHSIPTRMADASQYREQLRESARLIAEQVSV